MRRSKGQSSANPIASFSLLLNFLFLPVLAQDHWTWQNPLPQGNDLESIVFTSSDTGYAFGEAGTILKTTDRGTSWSIRTAGSARLHKAQFPNSKLGYVVGDLGSIFKTVDAGIHWAELPSGTKRNLWTLWFQDSAKGWVAGDSGTLLATTDGGASWAQVPIPTNADMRSVHFPEPQTGYAGEQAGALWKTSDAGVHWSRTISDSGEMIDIRFTNRDTGLAVYDTAVYRTNDGGAHWSRTLGGLPFGILSTQFGNRDTVNLTLMYGDFRRSVDGGLTWISVPGGIETKHSVSVWFVDRSLGFTAGKTGALSRTLDGGVHWESLGSNVGFSDANPFFAGLDFPTRNLGYVSTQDVCYRTRNGGMNWERVSSFENPIMAALFPDSSTGYAVGASGNGQVQPGFIVKTVDEGKSWQPQAIGSAGRLNCLAFAGNTLFVFGFGPGRKSSDGGKTWETVPSPSPYSLSLAEFIDAKKGFVGTFSALYRTEDGGQTWDSVSLAGTGAPGQPPIYKIHFRDRNTGFVLSDSGHIFRTVDGGGHWERAITPQVDYPLHTVAFATANIGYASGRFGLILKTTDAGKNWSLQEGGTRYHIFGLVFPDSGTGFAAGFSSTGSGSPGILKLERNLEVSLDRIASQKLEISRGRDGEFSYVLPGVAHVHAMLFDGRGRMAADLLDEVQSAGTHRLRLPDHAIVPGTYVLEFRAGNASYAAMVFRN